MTVVKGRKSTHGLRKRCPQCKKVRRFYEPGEDRSARGQQRLDRRFAAMDRPGFVDDHRGDQRKSRAGWQKIDGRWVCGWCNGTRAQP
jgi:phage FluMu protein Com